MNCVNIYLKQCACLNSRDAVCTDLFSVLDDVLAEPHRTNEQGDPCRKQMAALEYFLNVLDSVDAQPHQLFDGDRCMRNVVYV